jgi:hypothetical protein
MLEKFPQKFVGFDLPGRFRHQGTQPLENISLDGWHLVIGKKTGQGLAIAIAQRCQRIGQLRCRICQGIGRRGEGRRPVTSLSLGQRSQLWVADRLNRRDRFLAAAWWLVANSARTQGSAFKTSRLGRGKEGDKDHWSAPSDIASTEDAASVDLGLMLMVLQR